VDWAAVPTANNDQTIAFGISTNGDGQAVVVGNLVGAATFGTLSLNNNSILTQSDAFVTKVKKAPIDADFTLTASFPSGSTAFYQLSAVPAVVTPSFWWEVSEIDLTTGAVVPGTTMTNPSNWWGAPFISNNTFPGYCCNPTASTGSGLFALGHKYRITRGTWGPCSPWNAVSKTVYMSLGARAGDPNALIVENNPMYMPQSQRRDQGN